MYKNCCVVLVSYNPSLQILENVKVLISQVHKILIVDNGSTPDSLSILAELDKESSVNIQYNQANLGIATALNQGVKYALEHGYEWLATFDQDSLAPANYIKTMIDAYHDCKENESIALIAPRYQTKTGIISFANKKDEEGLFNIIKTTMTSGNLVKVDIFGKIGLFDDSFFIDYVDHEFCLRIRSKNLSMIESRLSLLNHAIGDSTMYNVMGIDIITTGHSATRRYYKYRNMIKTFKKYYWLEPSIILDCLKSLLTEPLKILLFEKEKFSKITSIVKGVLDGIIE